MQEYAEDVVVRLYVAVQSHLQCVMIPECKLLTERGKRVRVP